MKRRKSINKYLTPKPEQKTEQKPVINKKAIGKIYALGMALQAMASQK